MTYDELTALTDEYDLRTVYYTPGYYNPVLGEFVKDKPVVICGLVFGFDKDGETFLVHDTRAQHVDLVYYDSVMGIV